MTARAYLPSPADASAGRVAWAVTGMADQREGRGSDDYD